MKLDLLTVEVPPVEWRRFEDIKVKDNKVVERTVMWVGVILWPEGTRHNVSRFSWGSSAGHDQCQACGHAIKRSDNWVPLVAWPRDGGAPIALWVGRDCAAKLFGVRVEHNGELDRGTPPDRRPVTPTISELQATRAAIRAEAGYPSGT